MELDLGIRGDGGFVVLHDANLERETNGTGAVSQQSGADLAALRYKTQDCAPILSEDLVGLLEDAHPAALLQFDMKNTAVEVGSRGLDHFVAVFGGKTAGIIVSSGSIPLIRALVGRMPDLKRGYDPSDDLLALWPDMLAVERHLHSVLRDAVRPDMVYLEWQMVVAAARLSLDMVAMAHAEGVLVDAWTHRMASPDRGFTTTEAAEFAALMALKPDQITTDDAGATELAWRALSQVLDPAV